MSLAGNLEDLGLGEILQIVSLSRKTGNLSLHSSDREASIVFHQGLVVRASSSAYQQSLGEVLINKGIIDLALLRKALTLQQAGGFYERLGCVLATNFGISQDVVEQVVREQIEQIIFSLFTWSVGSFHFKIYNSTDSVDDARLNSTQFMLEQGLNPQFLAMEGARLLDEQKYAAEIKGRGTAPFDPYFCSISGVAATETVLQPLPERQQSIVLVDDDGPTLRALADGLTDGGLIVHAMSRSEDTLIKVDDICRTGERPIVLIDLIMPKMDGSGVLGGMELLELLHANFTDLQLMVMTDYHHAEAEQRIHELGYETIVKPRRVEIGDRNLLQSFLDRLLESLRNRPEEDQTSLWQARFNLGDELRIEMGDDDDVPVSRESSSQSSSLVLLRGMLEELNNPDAQDDVLLLVLRFASELMNRAIVFTISDTIISGSGQFGITGEHVNGDECVRALHVPQDSDSMFRDPLRSGQALTFKPAPTPLDTYIFNQLGGGIPDQVFIGPLISQNRVIGFLYGDNLPEDKPIGDVESLAIFLSQAGIAMEKSMLERQLNERVTP
jgi:CheY-like chemotaxis protein